ncbi:MAG: glycosyltransferase family 2 protein [Pontiellaceae bacterium]|nr:glycosyltransferase family 2 protein [Pontiellaceae bacterium]MBN2784549.1 glycosyltransferase family 2 protein [Pontiellaceae bacterium]
MTESAGIPLSCYIRTKNEAARIGPVVTKVREIGAEVIIVDSGSTDNTREIAREAGAVVIEKPWEGNGFQKRNGEDAASNEWLLDLDADEVLSPELQDEIKNLFYNGAPEPGIYALKLVTVPPVPKGAVWHHASIMWRNKLYHKSVVRMPAHAAWDQFKIPDGVSAKKINAALLHYSFLDIEQQVGKMNRVSTVRANETRLKPKGQLALRILFGFPFYFFKKYIFQQMFREGIYGFACAVVIASNRWLKDVKMYEIHLGKNGRNEI